MLERSLRITGETDDQFRNRIEQTTRVAQALIDGCLNNEWVQWCQQDEELATWFSEEHLRINPIVRVEFEQAIAFGGIGETLHATKNKHWGEGPQIMPLRPDDWFYPERITYEYRGNSLYNRRFLQRRRLKELLGKKLRKLVGAANYKRHSWEIFREYSLTPDIEQEIENRLGLTVKQFWRASRGTVLYERLPLNDRQLHLPFAE